MQKSNGLSLTQKIPKTEIETQRLVRDVEKKQYKINTEISLFFFFFFHFFFLCVGGRGGEAG